MAEAGIGIFTTIENTQESDLAPAVEFDEAAAARNIQAVRPGMEILKLSAKTGEGMAEYLDFLERRRVLTREKTGKIASN